MERRPPKLYESDDPYGEGRIVRLDDPDLEALFANFQLAVLRNEGGVLSTLSRITLATDEQVSPSQAAVDRRSDLVKQYLTRTFPDVVFTDLPAGPEASEVHDDDKDGESTEPDGNAESTEVECSAARFLYGFCAAPEDAYEWAVRTSLLSDARSDRRAAARRCAKSRLLERGARPVCIYAGARPRRGSGKRGSTVRTCAVDAGGDAQRAAVAAQRRHLHPRRPAARVQGSGGRR
jgi:hypothetical protein